MIKYISGTLAFWHVNKEFQDQNTLVFNHRLTQQVQWENDMTTAAPQTLDSYFACVLSTSWSNTHCCQAVATTRDIVSLPVTVVFSIAGPTLRMQRHNNYVFIINYVNPHANYFMICYIQLPCSCWEHMLSWQLPGSFLPPCQLLQW